MKLAKASLALVLAFVLFTTACTASWIKVALADLPILVQMALNISALVSTVHGQPPSQAEIDAINKIGAEAQTDLTLLQSLYDQYQSNPTTTNLQKIQAAIATLNTNLPALLEAAHISNATLQLEVSSAVQLILATVSSFAALMPNSAPVSMKASAVKPPTPKQLKTIWNTTICPAGASCQLQ